MAMLALLLALAAPARAFAADRWVDTTADVVNPADGVLSLREAVADSVAAGGANNIFLPFGDYVLSGELSAAPPSGSSISIVSVGGFAQIRPSGTSRVLGIDPAWDSASLALQGLIVRGGRTSGSDGGGGLWFDSPAYGGPSVKPNSLTIADCTFVDNASLAALAGGGAVNVGPDTQVTITNTTFDSNFSVDGPGGALYSFNSDFWGGLSVSGCTFTHNRTQGTSAGDGGAVWASAPAWIPSTLSGCTFTDNTAGAWCAGGAVYADGIDVNYSRLVNDHAYWGSEVYGKSDVDIAQARFNWWGSNDDPYLNGKLKGPGTIYWPWLVLRVAADSTTIEPHGSTIVHASILYGNDGTGPHTPPPGSPSVTWSALSGSMSPTSGVLSSGTATSTFSTIGMSGAGYAGVTVDSQTVGVGLTLLAPTPPTVTSDPRDAAVGAGVPASFTASAEGHPAPAVRWQVSTDGGATFADIPGATSSPYVFTAAATDDGDRYRAVFTNDQGEATSTAATLHIVPPPAFTSAPTAAFAAGVPGTFTVTTTSYLAAAVSLDGGSLPGGLSLRDNGDGTAAISGTPSASTGGIHRVVLRASASGLDTTQTLDVVVTEAPQVTLDPVDTAEPSGHTAAFSAAATGYPAPSAQWQSSADTGTTWVDIPGATGDVMSLTATLPLDGRLYRAVYTNAGGVATSAAAKLTVHGPPVFVQQPTDATVTAGSMATFSAAAESALPFLDVYEGGWIFAGWDWSVDGGAHWSLSPLEPPGWQGTGWRYADHYTWMDLTASKDMNGTLYRMRMRNDAGETISSSGKLNVTWAPAVTSADTATFTAGSAGAFTIATDANPQADISVAGTLPAGVSFADNGDGTGSLSGTPGWGSGGTYPLEVTAANGMSPDATQALTLTVDEAPHVLGQSTLATGAAGNPSEAMWVVYQAAPAAIVDWDFSLDGGSSWLPVSYLGFTHGTIPWTSAPTYQTYLEPDACSVPMDGTLYRAVITNASGTTTSEPIRLQVWHAPTIRNASETTFTVGARGDFSFATSGTPTPSLLATLLAGMPDGVALSTHGDGTGSIEGTPAAGTAGDYRIQLGADNAMGSDSMVFTLHVQQAPSVFASAEATFVAGTAGSLEVTSSGTPTATLSCSGTLPAGVTFVDHGDGTGALAGAAAAGARGVYPLVLTASNGVSPDATRALTLHVAERPSFTSADAVTFWAGGFNSFSARTSSVPTATLSLVPGFPPPGVSFTDNGDGTGSFEGTPPLDPAAVLDYALGGTTYPAGLYSAFLIADNGEATVATQVVGITVRQPTQIATGPADLTADFGSAGTYLHSTAVEMGGSACVLSRFWEMSRDGGTTWEPTDPSWRFGVIWSNHPDAILHDDYLQVHFMPKAYDGALFRTDFVTTDGTMTSEPARLTLRWAPTITSANATTFTVGASCSFTVESTASPAATLTVSGTLPSGVTFVDNGDGTASLGGTPAAGSAGIYPLTLVAGNGVGAEAVQSFTLRVGTVPSITLQPLSQFARVDRGAVFRANAEGDPAPKAQWQVSVDGGTTWSNMPGKTSYVLVVDTIPADDGHVYRVVFTNALGAVTSDPATLTLDGSVPVTTLQRIPGEWASDDVTFTLTATDTVSGVYHIHYQVGDRPWDLYHGQDVVTAEGTTVVSFYAEDYVFNTEPIRTEYVRIDRTPPRTTASIPATHAGSLDVGLSAEDTASGVASTSYSLDGGAWLDGTSLSVVTNGAHTLRFHSVDAVGNAEEARTATFTISTDYIPVAGKDRYGTAVAASKAAFPNGASAVIVGTGENWPDAISGSPLAGANDCPLLLTKPGYLPAPVAAEIRRLGATRVFILGRTPSVSAAVEAELRSIVGAGNVTRLGGVDRYETAAMIASETVAALHGRDRGFDGVAYVTSGANFPDALSVSPVAWHRVRPILLSRPETMPAPVRTTLASLGVTEAVVIGDDRSVGAGVYGMLSANLAGHVSRIQGADRYATSVKVAEYGVSQGLGYDGAALATGRLFPDALSGGVMQGKFRSVVLLTPPTRLDPGVKALLEAHAAGITHLRFLGGTASLPEAVRVEAVEAIGY